MTSPAGDPYRVIQKIYLRKGRALFRFGVGYRKAGHLLILQQILPSRIHLLGSIVLRHLGEEDCRTARFFDRNVADF